MNVLIVNQSEVPQLLPMRECVGVMEHAFRSLAQGGAIQPLRPVMWLPAKVGALGMMPSYLAGIQAMGLKAISVFPGNHGTVYDSHQGVVLLFESKNGRLLAIVDATSVTAIRTAAVSALATKLLARPAAGDLAILGSGTEARTHLEAMLVARPIRRVRVWSRRVENAARFAAAESERHGIKVEVVPDARAAVAGADLICTTTSSAEPILAGDWLAPGVHINAVGSSVSFTRELDTAAVVRARLFVDRRESALNEAGDFLIPKREGAIGDEHIAGELGDVLLGTVQGRRTPVEITLFKSLGLAIEDLAAAQHIYDNARKRGIGTWLPFGGGRV
jgi:ornithine cyclodeaminase/alanine dehydrogenase-like protein (mu-crystallin family)